MKESIFKVTLRNGLDPDANVLMEIGEAKTNEEAERIASDFINDPANFKYLQCKSYYVRGILYSETQPICTGLDYGSYSRFIFIKEEMALNKETNMNDMPDKKTSNASVTLLWNDVDNRDSFLLCLEEYSLKLLNAVDVDEDTVEITVYGPADEVARFKEDYEDGSIEPLESMSRSLEFDEDYEGWLNNEVWYHKQLMCYADMA